MRTQLVWTLIISMTFLPAQAVYGGPSTNQSEQTVRLKNVELSETGTVQGRLLDAAGKPMAGKEIEIRTRNSAQKQTTDARGQFTVKSEQGCSCAIFVDKKAYACRVWKKGTAPPKSLTSFGIVHHEGAVVRGQYDDEEGIIGGVSNGQLLGLGLLAGAIVAIVIAANNDDDGS
ncbi:MAG: hypothetical protein NXI04_08460 [Planctomycetaceae bacterium]|nr:hypothetical protein [Planctomycetaceae bacterium]